MEEKTCSKCKRSQPISEFYRNRRWRDGMHPWCKSCFNAAGKARYEKRCFAHPPAYRWNRDLICHNYFADVTTPMQAYLLGFLAADGNVLVPQNRISIELSVKDRDLLTLIRDELAPGHQIRTRTRTPSHTRYSSGESCVLAFSSSRMAADLAHFGIVPAKTHTLRWPDVLPQHLARDFLLGYFDGDGHVTYTVNFGHRYAKWGLSSGAPDFLRDIIEVVRTQTGITLGGPYVRGSKSYALRVTGKRALEMDEWLHQNGLGLARKRCTCP